MDNPVRHSSISLPLPGNKGIRVIQVYTDIITALTKSPALDKTKLAMNWVF